jgi:hypothetical protein
MLELECLTAESAEAAFQSCVPDCPCQPDQRESECFPYFSGTESDGDA